MTPEDPRRSGVMQAVKSRQPITVDVLYGDYEGGQRLISRFLDGAPGGHRAVDSCRSRATGTWTGRIPADARSLGGRVTSTGQCVPVPGR